MSEVSGPLDLCTHGNATQRPLRLVAPLQELNRVGGELIGSLGEETREQCPREIALLPSPLRRGLSS